MNPGPRAADTAKTTAWSIGILGAFLIAAGLVWTMRLYTQPAPLGAGRAEERRKNLHELRNTEADAMNNYAWVDQGKGIVRLPIQRALELTVQEWKNPSVARSNLIARVEKATEPPPKAPEKPGIYE